MVGALAAVNAWARWCGPIAAGFWAADRRWPASCGRSRRSRTRRSTRRTCRARLDGGRGEHDARAWSRPTHPRQEACRRFAIMAQDGSRAAIRPAHTPFDGDTVFALSTGRRPLADPRRRPRPARRAGCRLRRPGDRARRLRGGRSRRAAQLAERPRHAGGMTARLPHAPACARMAGYSLRCR